MSQQGLSSRWASLKMKLNKERQKKVKSLWGTVISMWRKKKANENIFRCVTITVKLFKRILVLKTEVLVFGPESFNKGVCQCIDHLAKTSDHLLRTLVFFWPEIEFWISHFKAHSVLPPSFKKHHKNQTFVDTQWCGSFSKHFHSLQSRLLQLSFHVHLSVFLSLSSSYLWSRVQQLDC